MTNTQQSLAGTTHTFYTNNAGVLTGKLSNDFQYLRGAANRSKLMGTLTTKDGTVYQCYVAACGTSNCFCGMRVKQQK